MKRFFLFAMAALAMLTVNACGGEGDSDIEGTWMMRGDGYHYFNATFNANGTYEWKWMGAGGIRIDAGDYTYVNGVIKMTPKSYKEEDGDGKLGAASAEIFGWNGPRTVKVSPLMKGATLWEWEGDWMMQSSTDFFGGPVIMFREDFEQNIKSNDLDGTWEYYYEEKLSTRVVIKGKNYTFYNVFEIDGKLAVSKEVGTWSHKGVMLTLTPTSLQYSYEYNKGVYTTYTVDSTTLESETWISAQYGLEPMSLAVCLFDGKLYTTWQGVYVRK